MAVECLVIGFLSQIKCVVSNDYEAEGWLDLRTAPQPLALTR